MSATTFYNSTNLVGIGTLNAASVSTTLANVIQANIQSMNVSGDSNLSGNLITGNIIMSSNLSTNSGQGNVYISANLVVNGNIFSIGGSVGSGSGTSQGVTYVLPSSYSLGTAFATGSAGPSIAGFHINMSLFGAQAIAAVSSFSASSGMLKFTSAGLYSVQCVLVGDQPAAKVGIGSTSSASFPPSVTATSGYVYVYNYPLNSSPTTLVTIPLTIQDTSKYYYLDAYFSTGATLLYQTAPPSGSAAGSNYGTYVQVGPFGNYLTSATGVASGLLMNCYGTTTLSSPVTSNTFRLAMTTANGWTVNGVSTSLAVTSGGNIQVNQAGIYEVSMCLNPSVTPMMFGIGSLSTDAAPVAQGPYLYQYAPMYTQDPTTVVSLPVNITDTSKYYYLDVIFPGSQATMALSNVSTFVSVKPVGSYVSPSTNPWLQQGTSVYYNSGPVGLGVVPTALTETLTVSGNTSFVGNVTQVTDASGSTYVTGKRTPAGSLSVANYVTGSVPLTTTTNLIQNYLSNAATITANTSTGTITQALSVAGASAANTGLNMGNGQSLRLSNLATSNLFIEMWVAPTTTGRFQNLLLRQNLSGPGVDIGFYISSGNNLVFFVSNATAAVTSTSSYALGTGWVHLAASYVRTSATQGTLYNFVNGLVSAGTSFGSATGSQANVTSTANIYMFHDAGSTSYFSGNVADVRVMTNCIVPVATFTAQSAPFTTAPTYVTGMSTGYTSNLTLALNSQYFPGASTSPYGPCLTLPGTVGSYYTETNSADNTVFSSNGFTFEYWVNYASFASTTNPQIGKFSPTDAGFSWRFDSNVNAGVTFTYYNGGFVSAYGGSTQLVTGRWNHCAVQSNGTNIYIFINGVLVSTTAVSGTPATPTAPITIGQQNNATGGNFAIAKARLVYGNDTSAASKAAANVYSSGNFTANPNFGPVPAGATVAWSLDSQYPLPTYPSIQDVTELPQQASSYGSLPTPIGGVTSNVVGPFGSSYPQLDSIRFDGTGYIDYGNAATSVMTTNIWANAWTIEAWVYQTNPFVIMSRGNTSIADWAFGASGVYPAFYFNYNGTLSPGSVNIGTSAIPTNTWTHLAVTYDGTRSNVYMAGALSNSMVIPTGSQTFYPQLNTYIGLWAGSPSYTGNLADVRVSNVARYTGTSPGAPTQPFSTDANTLLLLKSLGGQPATTLEVQGRGLNAVSLGATRSVQSYPPAPMSSYLLDTTGNTAVTYGQGKYVASASSEVTAFGSWAYNAFSKGTSVSWNTGNFNSGTPGTYGGTVVTVDTLGNSYAGEWLQIQMPVSVLLTSYSIFPYGAANSPYKFYIVGSRDGTNWTLVNSQTFSFTYNTLATFAVGATQAYNYYRLVVNQIQGSAGGAGIYQWTLYGTEESLCVTADSKIGIGLANPQRSLEVAGDLVVSGTISGGAGMGSFRNRIINGDMRIAQRGVSNVVPSTGSEQMAYMIDRWASDDYITSGGGSITQIQQTLAASDTPYQLGLQYSLRHTATIGVTSYSYYGIMQRIEAVNVADLMWGTSFGQPVTVSFWFRTNAPSGSSMNICIRSAAFNVNFNQNFVAIGNGQWQYVTLTIPPPPNGTSWATYTTLYLGGLQPGGFTATPGWSSTGNNWGLNGTYPWAQNAGNYIEFTGVQLEKGTVATPFDARSYATELALCQRYYTQLNAGSTYARFGTAYSVSTTSSNVYVPLPVTMRAQPTLTMTVANFRVDEGSSQQTVTSVTPASGAAVVDWQLNAVGLTVGHGAVAAANLPGFLEANNTTSAFLGFSAEL